MHAGLNNEGVEVYWWSSTPSSDGGYVMSYNSKAKGTSTSKTIRPYTDEGGYWGESVRCMVPGR